MDASTWNREISREKCYIFADTLEGGIEDTRIELFSLTIQRIKYCISSCISDYLDSTDKTSRGISNLIRYIGIGSILDGNYLCIRDSLSITISEILGSTTRSIS